MRTPTSSSLTMIEMPWDVEIKNIPFIVVMIPSHIHSINSIYGSNCLWMYPRYSKPNYKNMIAFNSKYKGACWGYKYEPCNYITQAYDQSICESTKGVMITRNGKDFFFCNSGIHEALYRLQCIDEHPLNLNTYKFDEKLIGRKVWWRDEPGIITDWIGDGQACVIIKPDGIEKFKIPNEDTELGTIIGYHMDVEDYVKTDIFDEHINWFRDIIR